MWYLMTTLLLCTGGSLSSGAGSRVSLEQLDDELIPSYKCDERTRDWTIRCLVPLTNFQMSIDLCGTNERVDSVTLQRCTSELYILGKSCPQPTLADAAREMMFHKPPPVPAAKRPIQPTTPAKKSANRKDKLSL